MSAATYESCTVGSRSDAIEQLGALRCATTAEMLSVIVAADAAEDWRVDGATSMRDWLVAMLRVSSATAGEWVRVGRALEGLPHLRSAFGSGALSWDQIAPATRIATPDDDEHLAGYLPGLSAAQVEEMARQRRVRTRRDAQRSQEETHLRWRRDHDLDGYRYSGFLPTIEGDIVNAALTRGAEQAGPNAETEIWAPFDQRAADALVDLARQDLCDDPGPDPTMVVVHADAEVVDGTEAGNGWCEGVQVPRDSILRLLCDTVIEFNVDGPHGTCVGIGRVDRTPPRWLRRRILRRDEGCCRFPGCGRRVRQVHHIAWWGRHDGPTDSFNLVGLCWHHHHLVHEDGWTIAGNADGELTFASPGGGRKLTGRPPPLRPDTRYRARAATGAPFADP